MFWHLKLEIILEVGLLVFHVFKALGILAATMLLAHSLRSNNKALGDQVEIQFANGGGILVVGHFQAGAKTSIAATVGQRVWAKIEYVVTLCHSRYRYLAMIMLPTAFIGQRCTAQSIVGAIGQITPTAPTCVRCNKPIGYLATMSA